MKIRRIFWVLVPVAILAVTAIGISFLNRWEPEYAYMPPKKKISNPTKAKWLQADGMKQYDIWGETITEADAVAKKSVNSLISPVNGAVQLNKDLLKLGRKTLYQETFGNEVFLTDIMGIVNGPLTITNIAKAIAGLRGQGTTNLQVELAKDVTLGGKTYKKGEKVDTGIDVAKGTYAPLGMPVKYSRDGVKVGISCMACHATVDPQTKMVVEGAPNADLNAGLLMALATNSTAYFTHTDVENLKQFIQDTTRTIAASDGGTSPLPDPDSLEKAVDETLAKWPRGNFDSTIDMKSNPAQIPDSFTKGGHPYGWSGFAAAGPFHGLSAFSNNVHAQNSDSLAQAEASLALFGIDKEVYLGTILQNSANPKFRFDPKTGEKPSDFFAKADPNPDAPGVNEMIKPPSFPKLTMMSPDGLFISSPGYKVGEQVNGMAAYQNTIVPPEGNVQADRRMAELGRTVFRRAQCISCHSGEAYTNHRIVSSAEIGTEPSRAKALKKTELMFGTASIYTPDTPVPIPPHAKTVQVPTGHLDPEQVKLAYAHGDSPGGYKVKGLIGLFWTAPYLHDGGVAVGKDVSQLGIPGTLMKGVAPDPANSLRALIDQDLRQKVVASNNGLKELQDVHVAGIGHEFWVDESRGYTKEQQDALIQYLLSLTGVSKP